MPEIESSVGTAGSAYYESMMKNSSLSKVSDLYKGMNQKLGKDKVNVTAPFRSETAGFDRTMDVLDISQQAYLLQTGFQKPEKEKESVVNLLKSEKKENSLLTYDMGTGTQKKENATAYGTLLNAQNNLNPGTVRASFTGMPISGQEKENTSQTKTGSGFDVLI